MHVHKAAGFFDRQVFDEFNHSTGLWATSTFKGQLLLADKFVSIWNRPTRKRMLSFVPAQTPTKSVIRVPQSGEIFLLGTVQTDTSSSMSYRKIVGLHRVQPAQLYRKTPTVNAGVKGWAVNALVHNTFADTEMRSVNEGQVTEVINYGHYVGFLPGDSPCVRHDTVVSEGITYYVLEIYRDSGLTCFRATVAPDQRVDFVYRSFQGQAYDASTQQNAPAYTSYNATGIITPVGTEDASNSEISKATLRVMLVNTFISFTPKVQDTLVYSGRIYRVTEVSQDAALQEWKVVATL